MTTPQMKDSENPKLKIVCNQCGTSAGDVELASKPHNFITLGECKYCNNQIILPILKEGDYAK